MILFLDDFSNFNSQNYKLFPDITSQQNNTFLTNNLKYDLTRISLGVLTSHESNLSSYRGSKTKIL